ncbi:MAG: hypothetical protein A3F72_08725 [Bacteroidetes bacterium RIFCSPLOWO2_12_FULL_35_15]|nr:MAG: hypothetical protein A3F72_08725 [Bacteroidetes bacterium RIFCSPLOWO2_12_FULL_35_15]
MTTKKALLTICSVLFFYQFTNAQNIGINANGTTPNSSAMLDIDVSSLATKKGLLIPRMTAAEIAAMSPLPGAAQGLIVYQTDGVQGFYYNTSSTTTPAWNLVFSSAAGGWSTTGNTGTSAATNFIGTTDAVDWIVKTGNSERLRVLATGNVGIGNGTTTPTHQLTIEGSGQTLRLIGPGVWGSTSKINFGDGDYVHFSEDMDDKLLINASGRTAIMGGNVGIGTLTPDGSAKFDITSTDKGLLIPRVTLLGTSDATTISSPATSLVVYNSATAGVSPNNVLPGFYYWVGSKWISLSGGQGGKDWSLTGNAGTTAGTNFMGTTDAIDLVLKSNNSEFIRIDTTGMVGIGTNNPIEKLHVAEGNILIENDYFIKNSAGYNMIGTEGGMEAGIAIGDVNSNSHLKLIIPPGAANALLFATPLAADYAYFTNTGNLGLGQVVPNERIRVNGNIQVDIPYHVKNSNGLNLIGTTLAGDIEIGDPATWDGLTMYIPQSGGVTFSTAVGTNSGFYDSDGNLGIATTTPSERLHVKQGNIKIEQNYHLKNFDNYNLLGTDFGGNQELGDPTNPKALLLNTPSGAGNGIYFVNPVAYGVYTNTGKFGIGTMDPTERFQLAGGNMQIDNNFFIKGKDAAGSALKILGINNSNWITIGDGTLAYEGINLVSSGTGSGAVKVSASTGGVIAYFSENGNVGIGTTSPLLKLDARGMFNKTGTAFENIFQVGSADVGNPVALRIGIKSDAIASDRYASIEVDDEGTKRALVVQPTGGNVGIGTAAPSEKLEICGNLKVIGTINASSTINASQAISCSSDFRFKKNITPLTGSLNKTLLLQGVNYNWKTEEFPERGFTNEKQIGFIAQEVEKIVPEIVYTDSKGFKSIDYSRLTPVLIEAIKELNTKVESLEKEIAETKLQNKKLEELNERIVLLEKINTNSVTAETQ